MSIEYPKVVSDGSTDFKTQRTEQSEFDYNNVPMVLNTVGNVNYNVNHNSNIPSQDDGKIVLDTYANETLKIKVTPSDGKKTIVQIIKRDDNSILECNTLHIGAVIKNNDELPDDYQGDGKFHLYKNLLNKDKPFRRSFSPTNKNLPQAPFDDYHPQLIKQSSTLSAKASNYECCLTKPINTDNPSEPACVSVSNNPYSQPDNIEKLCGTQSISNNANYKILYDKPYATAEFDDQYLAKEDLQPTNDNLFVKCVKSVINEAAKALECLTCGEPFSYGSNFINPFNTCNICYLQKQPQIKQEVCSSCRSDANFPDKLLSPTVSNHYEVFGPNIYRVFNQPAESSILSSDYNMVPFKLKDTTDSELISYRNDQMMPSVRTTIETKPPGNCLSPQFLFCTCPHNTDKIPSIGSLDSPIPSIDPLNIPSPYSPTSALTTANNRTISNNYYSPIQTPHSPTSNYAIDATIPTPAISTQRTAISSPTIQTQRTNLSTSRTLLQKVDPQLVKESLKQGTTKPTKAPTGIILDTQTCKFDFSQHISFDKIIKYPHVLLTIDKINNIEKVDRVLITSGNFVLNYNDLSLKGLRVPTIKPDQNNIRLVFETSPSTTIATRLLMHCGVAQKKKYYYVNLPLDLSDPMDTSGIMQLSLYGSNGSNGSNGSDENTPNLTYKIRKYIQGHYYMTCLPSLHTKFQYVSQYGDQLDELIGSIANNTLTRNYIFKQMDGTYTINGVYSKLTYSGDVIVHNDYFQGKLTTYLQQSKPQFNAVPISNQATQLSPFELPIFSRLLENVFSEWVKFVLPTKQVFNHEELVPTLKAHATAMIEALLIRLTEYLDGPILHPNFNKYLVPPIIYYNDDIMELDNTNCKAVFTYLWHIDSAKNMVGNTKLICKGDVPTLKNTRRMDADSIPQIVLVELSDVYNTNDGLTIVNNVIEREVQRILSFRNGHNDFIASIEEEIKLLI